jgi:lipopolysaccharide/colanic/teichoic acid biosynthesis glycosyltransferase
VVVAATAIVAFAPLLVAVWVAVRATSPGPALFRQERIGRDGRPFVVYKFRTMARDNSDDRHREYVTSLITDDAGPPSVDEGVYKLTDDERITPLGRWLRRSSLDELPQFFNVLGGSMSLVGPRPGLRYEVELYGNLERRRLLVKPGMTGLWQVSGRNNLSMREMFELDCTYVEDQSILLDLRILSRTPRELVRPSGAR